MRILLVVNESASSVTLRARVVIQKSLAADHQVTVAETSRPGHAATLAQSAVSKRLDAVVVLGGDGTVNETANGLAGSSTALGVLPGGSTNVFARTIGMTNDPIEATGELLSAMSSPGGGVERVGLGNAGGRKFLFHCGIGFDAAVVEQVDRRSHLKRYLGHTFFGYSAIRTWATGYDRHHPHFSLTLKDLKGRNTDLDDGYFAIVMNTSPYTFVGERAFDLAPGTDLSSALSVVQLKSISAPTLGMLAARSLHRGATSLHGPSRRGLPGYAGKALLVRDVSRVSAVAVGSEPFPYQVDGEPIGRASRLELRWEPDALNLIVPVTTAGRHGNGSPV